MVGAPSFPFLWERVGRIIEEMSTSEFEKSDTQLVELAGRNWLASQLQRARVEVARPERDRGIDLIAYLDRDADAGQFIACPIQMKAATKACFSLDPKYQKFCQLLLVYIWNLGNPSETTCFALTYKEAETVAKTMRYTETRSWIDGASSGKRGYSPTAPSERLRGLLQPHQMTTPLHWLDKIRRSARRVPANEQAM
jgi:hypothetical protein